MGVVYRGKKSLFKFEVTFDNDMISLKCTPNENGIVDFCNDYSIKPEKVKELVDNWENDILVSFEKFNISLSEEIRKGGSDYDEEFAYYS